MSNLKKLEDEIEQGFRSAFARVGLALATIRDNKLYLQEFETFDDYCQVRWGVKRAYCNELIRSALVFQNLETNTSASVLPSSVAHCRPLAKLEPKKQVEVWRRVTEIVGNKRITAEDVASTAQTIRISEDRNERYRVAADIFAKWITKNAGCVPYESVILRWAVNHNLVTLDQVALLEEDIAKFCQNYSVADFKFKISVEKINQNLLKITSFLNKYEPQELSKALELMASDYRKEVVNSLINSKEIEIVKE